MHSSTAVVLLSALAGSALAAISPTSPVAATTCTGGDVCKIAWIDDGKSPSAASMGETAIDLYTGSDTQQTLVASLTGVADPATVTQVSPTIPANVGPNGQYFIRFTSHNLKDAAGQPVMAFSTRFTMTGMTGQANASAATVAGGAAATVAAPSAASGSSASATAAAASVSGSAASGASSASRSGSSSGSSSASASSSAASASASKSGAESNARVVLGSVVGAVVLAVAVLVL